MAEYYNWVGLVFAKLSKEAHSARSETFMALEFWDIFTHSE